MAENFSFFDPVEVAPGVWDREYFAQQFTDYFRRLVTTGVMKGESGELKVSTEGNSMITTLSTGVAYVVGRSYENTSPLTHTHDTEVLVRLDLRTESRFVKSFIKKGVASTSPVPPDLQRDQFIYEISLAQVKVIGGQTYINVNDVVDERGKTDICPWAGSKILPNFDNATLEEHIHDYLEHIPFVVTTKSGYVYKVNLDGVTSYIDGLSLAIKIDEDSNGAMYLSINDLGNKNIYLPNGMFARAGDLKKDVIYTVRYSNNINNSGGFVLQGGGITLNNTITSNSTTEAATANAVKMVNDKLINTDLALGLNAMAGYQTVSLGFNSQATKSRTTAVGGNAKASGAYSTALGADVSASGESATSVGDSSRALGQNGVALGSNAKGDGQHSIGVGFSANASGIGAISIGTYSTAPANKSIAIGYSIDSTNSYRATLGAQAGGGIWDSTDYWLIPGTLSVQGTKNFEIPHPHPDKTDTHLIRHGAVESPTTGDTLYRYSVKITDNKAKVVLFGENKEIELPITEKDEVYLLSIPLPDYFIYLNTNEQVFVNADKHFGLGFGEINRETGTLELTLNSLKDYNVMLLGTRNDKDVQRWYIKGIEREIGEGWEGQTYSFEIDEFNEYIEITEGEY